MNLIAAILRRELSALPRHKRFYLARCALVAVGSAVIVCGLMIASASRATTVGLTIFTPLCITVLAVVSMMAASSSSSLVMREKQERTLGLLFLSDISSWSFMLGKLFTSLHSMVMAILSVLPMFMLAVSLGGVSAVQILMAAAVLLSTVFLVACLGLLAAVLARTENTMNGLLSAAYLALFVLLPMAIILRFAYRNQPPPATLLFVISPFGAMVSLIQGHTLWPAALNCSLSVGLGLPLLWLTQSILPRRVFSKDAPTLYQRLRERIQAVARVGRWGQRGPIRGNPVAWRDMQYWHGGARAVWLKWLISTVLVAIIALLICWRLRESNGGEFLTPFAIMVLTFSAGAFALGCLSHCAMAFSREKTGRTLEVLLTTDLSDREIVAGKISAAVRSLLPWLLGALACAVGIAVAYGHEYDFWQGAGIVASEYLSMWFGYSCLALWISLRFRKNQGFAACFALLMLWNTLGRAFLAYLLFKKCRFEGEAMVVVDVVVHAALGAICLARVLSSFRRLALRSAAGADG